MKRKIFTLTALFSALALWAQTLVAAVPDGVSLRREWKRYDRIARQDLPEDEMAMLSVIMEKSRSRRLPVDFYEAAWRYRDRRISRSWKERDEASRELKERILSFDMPALTVYYYSREDVALLTDYVVSHADELRKTSTPVFYRSHLPVSDLGRFLSFRNDLEYAAWLSLAWGNDSRVLGILEREYAGSYPESALVEYHKAVTRWPVKPDMVLFAEKYRGRGAALLAEDWLLRDKVASLTSSDTVSCETLLALKAECLDFQTRLKSAAGNEKWLGKGKLTAADDGLEILTARSVSAVVRNNVLQASFVNVEEADVTLLDGRKTVYRTRLVNHVCSFFRPDTLSLPLPDVDDGRYALRLKTRGADPFEIFYEKASISVAVRRHEGRFWLYAADFMSGRPVEKVDMTLKESEDGAARKEVRNVRIDGFTSFPEAFESAMAEQKKYVLTCSYRDAQGRLHKSKDLDIDKSGVTVFASGTEEVTEAKVLMGSGAYHPGDTVRFKVIAYEGDIYSSLRTVSQGRRLEVAVTGQRNFRSELVLFTNEFGSAAGEMVIPEDAEGGQYSVTVSEGKKHLGSALFRLDEYVLPTFRISFEDDSCFWFKGDSVTVRGKVESYSGHVLTSAALTYVCGNSAGKAEIESDGSFSFRFVPESSSRCEVKVTDATGETCTASRSVRVRRESGDTSFYLRGSDEDSHPVFSGAGYQLVNDPATAFSFRWDEDIFDGAVHADVSYKVTHDGAPVFEGTVGMGEGFRLAFTGRSCLYEIEALVSLMDQNGVSHENRETFRVLYLADDADVLDAPVENLLKEMDGGDVKFLFGAGLGDVWAVAELWGCDHSLLREETIHLSGGRGVEGSLKCMDWKYQEDWPEVVELRIFYFRNGRRYRLSKTFRRPTGRLKMPVEFTRFADKTLPGNSYEFSVRALPHSECLVAVYDASADKIWANRWNQVALRLRPSYIALVSDVCGSYDSEAPARIMYKTAASSGIRIRGKAGVMLESVEEGEAIPFQLVNNGRADQVMVVGKAPAMGPEDLQNVDVRDEYADVLAFEPFLRTGDDGGLSFSVATSDKLSTYHVAVYAHDRDMHNGTVTRDMTVSLPVKVSLVQPRILYEGDRYVLHANVSNSSDEDIDGIFGIDIFDGTVCKDVPALRHTQGKAHVPAGGSASLSFPVGRIPHCGSGVLGLKVVFASRNSEGMNMSDGMFVTVPVEAPEQEITEAHSALLMGGGDRRHLYDSLMAQFSNGRASETVSDEILIADQLHEVLGQSSETDAEDAVSLSSAMVFRMLASHLKGENADAGRYADALLMLQRADGGFAWLGGMESSAPVTAVVLERLARLKALGIMPAAIGTDVVASAVRYLDSQYFTGNRPSYWRPVLSQGQYFYVRSLYAEIPLVEKLDSQMKDGDRDYLTPSREYTGGCVFHKARRIRTIANLQSSDAGVALAKAWGVKLLTSRRLDRTLERDLASLMQYAVAHPSGGIFYPNAVMPWRGLMESELYAHSFICDLFRDIESSYPEHAARASEIAGGIRLWIMVQKETQKWASDPAFAEAVASVMDGSEALMDARLMVLKRSVRTPFSQVRKSGNGMSVDVRYSIRRGDRWEDLKGGEVLPVGETVRATYTLWSGENRSFVCLAVPRPGCLVPVVQTSGYTWWNCYRRVRSDRTEYYWDAFPEEKTSVTEEFHVSQEGTFTAPAAHIESAYAPHYRANTGATLPIRAELLN